MSDVYRETILALKHFTDARRRLDAATDTWDNCRHRLLPQLDIDAGKNTFFFIYKSEYLGEAAREFLSAHNAYRELGSSLNYPNNDGHYPGCLHIALGHPCFCKTKIE